MTTAPAELTYGYVDGRFILIVGDTSDAGRMPDPVPATDTAVQITPKQPLIRVTGADPTTVVKQPITCTLDKDGRLLDPEGERGVWLVTGAYTVTYRSPKATIPSHDIEVTAEHTESSPLYLTRAIPPGGPVLTPTQYAELSARIDGIVVDAAGVSSVNGATGEVVLDAEDVGALPSTYTPPAQSWTGITGKPTTFAPASHAASHATGGSDPITPESIGAATAAQGTKADSAVQPDDVDDVIREGDARLTDARTPTSHSHDYADITDPPTIPGPQTLSLTGSDLTLSDGGGTVTLPSGGGGGGGASRYGVPTFGLSNVYVWNFRDMSGGSVEAANGTALLTRVMLADDTPIKAIGMQVHTAGSAGAVIRVSLYASDGAGGGPGTLIVDAGTVDATTSGWKEATFTAVTAPAGPVWVALAAQGSPATPPRIAGGGIPAHLALPSLADFVGPSGIAQGAGMTGPASSTWAYTIALPHGQVAPSVALRTA